MTSSVEQAHLVEVPVILASQSPRRRELLTLVGIRHVIRPADIDESLIVGESPRAYVERLAREKVEAISAPDAVTIGSDTTVVVDGDILAKPTDESDAFTMLRRLSGRSHIVLTAVAARWLGRTLSAVEEVLVEFRPLSDAEVRAYIATGEPMDKAGAYGIQGYGATIVDRVDGDYFAVMGLPLNRLARLLESLGLVYRFGALQAPQRAGKE